VQLEIPGTASADFGNTELGRDSIAPEYEVLKRTFYKTLSYQALGSVFDVAFGVIVGGELVMGGVLALANAASDLALTYAHDLSWATATRDSSMSEGDTRAARTTTHMVVNTAQCLGLGLLVTGSAAISAGYVAFNTVTDAALYAANDWMWERIWPLTEPSAPQLAEVVSPDDASPALRRIIH
jgi:uncharacterized membrane protein